MKKLNLKDIKNGMSRNEKRNIKGGCGGNGCLGKGSHCEPNIPYSCCHSACYDGSCPN